jgi:hypothetical protein
MAEAAAAAQFARTHGGPNTADPWFACSGVTEPRYGMEVTTRDGRTGRLSFVAEQNSIVGSCHPILLDRRAAMRREHVMICVAYGTSAADARFVSLTSSDFGEWVALKGPFVL